VYTEQHEPLQRYFLYRYLTGGRRQRRRAAEVSIVEIEIAPLTEPLLNGAESGGSLGAVVQLGTALDAAGSAEPIPGVIRVVGTVRELSLAHSLLVAPPLV